MSRSKGVTTSLSLAAPVHTGGAEAARKKAEEDFLKNSPPPKKSALLATRLAALGNREWNNAISYALDMVKSEAARLDGRLCEDFSVVMKGNCIYLEGFACKGDDYDLFNKMKAELVAHSGDELDKDGLIPWSKHQIYENPANVSAVFTEIVDMMADYFDVEVYATRLNYYRDGTQWKPYHHDSHAYGSKNVREDFTMGITLGATRALSFLHEPSKMTFAFPQKNGDMFAFTTDVNTRFMHGVPRTTDAGDRFSIIAWGKRRTINERNGGKVDLAAKLGGSGNVPTNYDDAISAAHTLLAREAAPARAKPAAEASGTAAVAGGDGGMGTQAVSTASSGAPKAKRPKNRLQ